MVGGGSMGWEDLRDKGLSTTGAYGVSSVSIPSSSTQHGHPSPVSMSVHGLRLVHVHMEQVQVLRQYLFVTVVASLLLIDFH